MTTKAVEVRIEERKGRLGPERFYITPAGEFPSVTTVLSMSGMKGPALINWAVSKAVEQVIDISYATARQWGRDSNGEPLPASRFVEIVSGQLKDAKRADRAALEAAGGIGTKVHKEISSFLVDEGSRPYVEGTEPFDKWRRWWESKPRKAILVEQPIWNEFSGYAGTIDCVAEEADGSITLYDWKTSSGIYADHHLQAAAYALAYTETYGSVPFVNAVLVHIPKNGGAVREVALGEISKDQKRTPDELFDAFLGLLEAWKVLH